MADSIEDQAAILSAVFKAKADNKDGADGFSRKGEPSTFFDFFKCPILLKCYYQTIIGMFALPCVYFSVIEVDYLFMAIAL
jgi:hypothetical protein